jgi:hypothetical protein
VNITYHIIYLTDENMAVRVRSVVMEIPILASTIVEGIRNESHVMKMKNALGR